MISEFACLFLCFLSLAAGLKWGRSLERAEQSAHDQRAALLIQNLKKS